jgi:ParB family chromosome partitioning protein
MKLSTSLVAVRKITATVPRSNFSGDELERTAQLILAAEGIINPIVLRRTSLESYQVVHGNFEYYAAARAKEIDLRKGEMIGAFIVEDENEEVIKEQIEILRNPQSNVLEHTGYGVENRDVHVTNMESQVTNINSRLTNLETRLENRISELKKEHKRDIQTIEDRLKEFEDRLPKPIKPLDALNKLRLPELVSRLKKASVNAKIVEKIVSERETNGNFKSCSDVVNRVKGLGDKTMIKIVDSFSEYVS